MAWDSFDPPLSGPLSNTPVLNTYLQLLKGRETDLFVESEEYTRVQCLDFSVENAHKSTPANRGHYGVVCQNLTQLISFLKVQKKLKPSTESHALLIAFKRPKTRNGITFVYENISGNPDVDWKPQISLPDNFVESTQDTFRHVLSSLPCIFRSSCISFPGKRIWPKD